MKIKLLDYASKFKGVRYRLGAAGPNRFDCSGFTSYVFSKFGYMFTPIGNVGEDIAFCWRARQCGYKILADPSISLGHVGQSIFSKPFFDNYKKALAKGGEAKQ